MGKIMKTLFITLLALGFLGWALIGGIIMAIF